MGQIEAEISTEEPLPVQGSPFLYSPWSDTEKCEAEIENCAVSLFSKRTEVFVVDSYGDPPATATRLVSSEQIEQHFRQNLPPFRLVLVLPLSGLPSWPECDSNFHQLTKITALCSSPALKLLSKSPKTTCGIFCRNKRFAQVFWIFFSASDAQARHQSSIAYRQRQIAQLGNSVCYKP